MIDPSLDLAIKNAMIASIKSVLGEDVDCNHHPRLPVVWVKYCDFSLRLRADDIIKATDPSLLTLSVQIGKTINDVSLPVAKKLIDLIVNAETEWYVVRDSGGKFADGFYGFDGNIHSDEQIYAGNCLPYIKDAPGIENILVGKGAKPSPFEVNEKLIEMGVINDG